MQRVSRPYSLADGSMADNQWQSGPDLGELDALYCLCPVLARRWHSGNEAHTYDKKL